MIDFANIDQASPALTGTPSTIPAATAPTVAAPKQLTWKQMLETIMSLSGGSGQLNNIAGLTQGLGSNVNSGIPLYTPPLQAMPMAEEQQRQTTQGDVNQYASVIASMFGGAGGASFTGAGVGTPIT